MGSTRHGNVKAVLERLVTVGEELEEKGVVWVGHNSLTVEKKIIEEELGLKQPIPIRCKL